MPFCDDIANVSPEEFSALHKKFMVFAKAQQDNPKKVDRIARLQANNSVQPVLGQVIAFNGTQDLTAADIAAHPRLIAKVYTTERYNRGLQGKWSYVVVGGRKDKGWRVVLISQSDKEPVTVVYDWRYKPQANGTGSTDTAFSATDGHGMHAMVEFFPKDSVTAWKASMTQAVATCYSLGFGACLVNRKGAAPFDRTADGREGTDTDYGNKATDQWVWVTETGCVCLGTQCHTDSKR